MEQTCDRCKIGTEYYLTWDSKIGKVVLCDECCKNFLLKMIAEQALPMHKLIEWAHETTT